MKRVLALTFVSLASGLHADPQLTSWFTANSGKYARIYQSTANETAGTTSTTWSRGTGTQTNPTYADVNEINYSASWVYIRTTGLASHIMGPWYLDAAKTQNFPNFPSNTAVVYRIPRTPTIPATKTATGLGATGRMVNGVSMFDSRDAFSYVNASGTDATPTNGLTGDGIWNRDGYHNEGVTFDPGLAHQAGNNYHYHAQPIALRYQLGDHVDYNATTNRYTESTAPVTAHSPIVAWAADGLPVYGPYGYSLPMDSNSGVRRMISGYTKRDGTNGTTAITVRQVLPLWAQRFQGRTTLTSGQYGPTVNATYALGHYIEDFDYRGDLGQTLGVDFDLNEQNVRFCVTPEYPSGTWAYFTTINADGTPAYPYTTGRQYYGSPTGGASNAATMNADTPLTQHFIGGANKALTISTPSVSSPNVTLTWSAVEGGTYSVDASTNQSTWTSKATGVVATSTSASSTHAMISSSGTEYGRVSRTALATYDSNGQSTATVSQTTTTSYQASGVPNSAPTITSLSAQTTPQNTTTSAQSFTIDDAETSASTLTVTGSSSNTSLVANSSITFTGSGAVRNVTVSPITNQTGTVTITVNVSDGSLSATSSFVLTITPSAPTITNVIHSPSAPTSSTSVNVTAAISPPSGRTIATAQLSYNNGSSSPTVVFNETMGTAAAANWTGTGTVHPWTIAWTGPPQSPFQQATTANHTPVGQGNQFGMAITNNAPAIANSTMTTTNAINATGTSGTVTFWIETTSLTGTQGWDFQTSTDGTTYTTRLSELTGSNHAFQQYTYTLTAGERVNTLKLRFRFAGPGANSVPTVRLDDIVVTIGGVSAPTFASMFDDGAHGDDLAGDGIYGAIIPAYAADTTVTYIVSASDNTTASTTSSSANYTVGTGAAAMTVTPVGSFAASGPAGGPFTPASTSYTITNSGTATLNWSVSKSAAWISLDSTSGTLAPNATATVAATLSATALSLTAGSYTDTVSFTNTSNGIGNTTRSASLTVLSTNSDLSALVPSEGTLTPSFATNTVSYSMAVANAVSSITVTPTAASSGSSILVNSSPVTSGISSNAIALSVGPNSITIAVTAQDGATTKTYSISITRESAVESWRQTWYGSSSATSIAADDADPFHTGIPNLLVLAFFGPSQDPATARISMLPQPLVSGGTMFFSFTQPAGVSGITYGAEWSTTMKSGEWFPVTDTGSGNQHVFSIPMSGTGMFMRLKVTSP